MAKLWLRKQRRVLLDIDTQSDLLTHYNGLEPEVFLRHIRRLIAWARHNRVPVVSTSLCLHADKSNGSGDHRSLCIEGTPGQRKIRYTLLPRRLQFDTTNSTDLPPNLLSDYQQIIFEKRTDNTFELPRADRFLTGLRIDEFIVFGTGTEHAIHHTVLGLLARRKSVSIVTDAITGERRGTSQLSLRKMTAKGARLITTESLTGRSRLAAVSAFPSPAPCRY